MMKALVWNIRGIGNRPSVTRLKRLIKMHKVTLYAILEPKISKENLSYFQRKSNCKGAFSNEKSTIWVFWKEELSINLLNADDQFMQVEVASNLAPSILITFVYASCDG